MLKLERCQHTILGQESSTPVNDAGTLSIHLFRSHYGIARAAEAPSDAMHVGNYPNKVDH
jgi:hypothetical protein